MSSHDDVFDGPSARSRVAQTTIWCGGCKANFSGRYQHSIDADAEPALVEQLLARGYEALNGVKCPKCGWRYVIESLIRVHRPGAREMVLVLPERERHLILQSQAQFLAEVAEAPGTGVVPDYVTSPIVVAGLAGLTDALGLPPRVSVKRQEEPPTPDESLPFSIEPFGTPAPTTTPISTPVKPPTPIPLAPTLPPDTDAAPARVDVTAPPPTPPEPEPEPDEAQDEVSMDIVSVDIEDPSKRPSGLLEQVLRKRPDSARGDDRWNALDEGWTLNSDTAEPNEEPTQMVQMAPESAPPTEVPAFDTNRALGRGEYLSLVDGHVRACAKLSKERASGFVDGTGRVRFQLHQPSNGPVMMLVLERTEPTGEPVDHCAWTLSPKLDRDVLDALADTFTVDFQLFDAAGIYVGQRRLRAPLERNVEDARAAVVAAKGHAKHAKTSKAVMAPGYDRLGKLRHNFDADSFDDTESAADARLALGIVSYWSAPERREYLLRIQSFPVVWYEAMIQRVVEGAIKFGLAMEPHLRQASIDMSLVEDTRDLLKRTLANFAEVNLNLKPSGLDPLDIWDNWEALLAYAEELDVRVDADIEDLAAQAMERAREAAQQEAIEVDPDDASVELEEFSDLSDLGDEDLIGLLDDQKNRMEATLALLSRSRTIHVPAVFETVCVMSRPELLRIVPSALAMGPAFEGSFIDGLASRRTALRLASALFLAEIRSEKAVAPLLRLIPSASDDAWPILARAAARMGRRIINPVLEIVAADGDSKNRLAETLALLGPDARPALVVARDQKKDAKSAACLERALNRVGEVSFADAADFTERLGEAFAAAGDEEFGPDFSESIVSIELGPGSSVSDLEADVDFGSLDDK